MTQNWFKLQKFKLTHEKWHTKSPKIDINCKNSNETNLWIFFNFWKTLDFYNSALNKFYDI